jgi:hypothetical protein
MCGSSRIGDVEEPQPGVAVVAALLNPNRQDVAATDLAYDDVFVRHVGTPRRCRRKGGCVWILDIDDLDAGARAGKPPSADVSVFTNGTPVVEEGDICVWRPAREVQVSKNSEVVCL